MTETVPLPSPPALPPAPAADGHTDALRLLLADTRSPQTRRAYAADLRDFFAAQAQETGPEAVARLCALTPGALALALNEYKTGLIARGLGESTVNRRLSAVRSLLRMARRLGVPCPDPTGLVLGERSTVYRDTRGPAVPDGIRLLAAPDRSTLPGMRDYALLVLLAENALRRAEVCACDVADFDERERRLRILGKGKGSQKEWVTLSPVAADAIAAYLWARAGHPGALNDTKNTLAVATDVSGPDSVHKVHKLGVSEYSASNKPNEADPEPLFTNVARRYRGAAVRLTPGGLYYVLQGYGRRVLGRPLNPHSLRHAAITAALDATGGDVRRAQRLSRHADVRTLQRYDDNREDLQGEVTGLLSAIYHRQAA